ncbi:Vtype proton ATPase subunit C, putative [Acanthamoeba castellanii str. Neff]|jgi:V-type H+-transporting ATPase subunit C|uniref:V-type proton ATPase subunit C n=1 Tax=Acanthamoeba castellanii (strain ATCC 30010 / Neff) TaxID=1257118 RepID=L8H2N9_ACACF|nr:Vtype proton ATPase subunit C, putative [Acanthamoeba castellanii str. Neff]ELR18631.1 Vtype proton ATPase subunit C, putative [Acanthamoeba castellanii str. Neff]
MKPVNFSKDETKQFWLVSVPNSEVGPHGFEQLRSAVGGAGVVSKFKIPSLRVGSLDSLLALSEDLGRKDQFFEGVVNKIARQLRDLYTDPETGNNEGPGAGERILAVNNIGLDSYLSTFEWDEAKYKLTSPLKDVIDAVSTTMTKIDEELRTKSASFQSVTQAIAAEKKKATGNLMVRDLSDLIKPEDAIDTDYLTTLFVVVNKAGAKEWLDEYETIVSDVVPRSSDLLYSDSEFNLYNVILFKKMADDFKTQARKKKWTVREYKFDAKAVEAGKEDLKKFESKRVKQKNSLIRWCRLNFAEAFTSWVHLKAIRTFIEAVLRFGLPAEYTSAVIEPGRSSENKLRKTLDSLYAKLGSSYIDGGDEVDAASLLAGVSDKFYPYVWSKMSIATSAQ